MASINKPLGLMEGDYVETHEGLLFTVKGIHHPKGYTIAYLRYIPDSKGERCRDGLRYRRVYDLEKTNEFLKEKYPQYLNHMDDIGLTLQSIPNELVAMIYKPKKKLREILAAPKHGLEQIIVRFTMSLIENGAPPEQLGVSGSALIGLARASSDVDLISYSYEAGQKVFQALKKLRDKADLVKPYDSTTVKKVTISRWSDTSLDLEMLGRIETRKILHGLVDGKDYFVRLVRDPDEFENEVSSCPLAPVTLMATIKEARYSIFTPCTYEIEDCSYLSHVELPEPMELISYRGKFTEQAKEGERVEARGTLEKVKYADRSNFRMILGRSGDYLVPVI